MKIPPGKRFNPPSNPQSCDSKKLNQSVIFLLPTLSYISAMETLFYFVFLKGCRVLVGQALSKQVQIYDLDEPMRRSK